MAWDNDHIPVIRYEVVDNLTDTIAPIAATLAENGMGDVANDVIKQGVAARGAMELALHAASSQTLDEVQNLMRSRQYHSKSGYEGHGNMVKQTSVHHDGFADEIYSEALGTDGYNYSQAFEFGLLTKNYPAHHPFTDAANHLNDLFVSLEVKTVLGAMK